MKMIHVSLSAVREWETLLKLTSYERGEINLINNFTLLLRFNVTESMSRLSILRLINYKSIKSIYTQRLMSVERSNQMEEDGYIYLLMKQRVSDTQSLLRKVKRGREKIKRNE